MGSRGRGPHFIKVFSELQNPRDDLVQLVGGFLVADAFAGKVELFRMPVEAGEFQHPLQRRG